MSEQDAPDKELDAVVNRLIGDLDATAKPPDIRIGKATLYALVLVVTLVVAFLLSTLIPAGNLGAFAAILSGLAALALAILTGILLVLNQRLISATFKMAQATTAEAIATLAEARASSRQVEVGRQTLEAMQLDQEMAWRPYLMTRRDDSSWMASVENVGRGPALRILYFELDKDGWYFAGPKDMAVGQKPWLFDLRGMPNPHPKELFGHTALPGVVIACCDQFGNWLKFEPFQPAPTTWRARGGEPKADWVEWVEIFGLGPDTPIPAGDDEAEAT